MKTPTAADVRKAMDSVRSRLEVDDAAKEKYHKPLTSAFKSLSAALGSDKPSLLSEDKRQSFIDACALLDIMPDGTIGTPLAF